MIICGVFVCAAVLAYRFQKKIDYFIAFSMILMTLISYLFLQIGHIEIGLFCVIGINILAMVIFILICLKNSDAVNKYVFTPGLWGTIFAVAFFYIFSQGVDISKTVDSFFWVGTPKLLYYSDDIEFARTRVINIIHPLLLCNWGYLVEKTCVSWNDSMLLLSKNTLMFSALLPLGDVIANKELSKTNPQKQFAIFLLASLLIPCMSFFDEYNQFDADVILGVMLGMGLVLFATAIKKDDFIIHIIAMSYIVAALLTKRSGVIFVVLILCGIIFLLCNKKQLKLSFLYIIVNFSFYVISQLTVSKYALAIAGTLIFGLALSYAFRNSLVRKVWCIALVIFAIVGSVGFYFWMNKSDYYREASLLYIHTIFTTGYSHVGNFIKLSLVAFGIICFVIYCGVRYKQLVKKEDNEAFILACLTYFAYLFIMLFLYVVLIIPANWHYGMVLAAIDRYMVTAVIMLLCVTFYIIVQYCKNGAIYVLFICLALSDVLGFSKYILERNEAPKYDAVTDSGIVLDMDTNIGYIDLKNGRSMAFEFAMYPAKSTNAFSGHEVEENGDELISKEELESRLSGNEYIYIDSITDGFVSKYSSMFLNADDIKAKAVYEFNEDGKLILIK
ncbi:hypothetical protein [Butyrivibrio sp. YAB3001]|uniref:hypothetical protein n=1 Tax=Butyrivibrio sp. YAB3001 TaxID=1520812 RepID=UPI0008F64CFD|nr:hypothetical protein [Butyrivibrio sp. YAB3001]SFD09730.1 hypothetical protein SAMN02910398_04042 [Butyrivibrio sp. YAB3001]